jgi:signal transduction histidine kinase
MTAGASAERPTPGWFKSAAWVWVGVILLFSIVAVASGRLPDDDPFVTWLVVLAPFFAVLAAVIATRAPGNVIAWLMGTIGTGIAFGVGSDLLIQNPPEELTPVMLVFLALNGMWWVFFMFPILLTLFLFPTGHFLTKRWRWAGWLIGVMTGVLFALSVLAEEGGPASGAWTVDNPFGFVPVSFFETYLEGPWSVGLIALAIGGLSSMVVRFRRSETEERAQIKWVLYSAVLLATLYAGSVMLNEVLFVAEDEASALIEAFWGLFSLAFAFVPISIAIAITRYRLYDIDLIINRTLVFVVLVGFITVVYTGVVVGIGSLVVGSGVGWSIAATALVAVVFEPVRDRVQRWANRLVYGRRATPYEVLADLTGRLAATEREEGLLGRMAIRLVEGTGADRAIVWSANGPGFAAAACEPDSGGQVEPVESLDAIPGSVVPISYEGVVLGALSVESRRGDALTPTERRLVDDLAGSAGLLMRRIRLDAELERKAAELEESRRRLVDAQDVERRRLERELNEGAQQQVVALKVQLALAEQQARGEGSEKTASLLAQMAVETQDAIDQIQALANGIYPPLLEAEGLATAVRALGELAPVDVRVDTDVSRRYPLPLEGAVYFCVSEALTNAVKHGREPIAISVVDASGELAFTVADSGPGFDPTTIRRGSGLNNMTDRLDVLEGTITIDTTPGIRTVVAGRLPLTLVEAMA